MGIINKKGRPGLVQLINFLIYLLVFSFSLIHIPGITWPALEPRWTLLNFAAVSLVLLFLIKTFNDQDREPELTFGKIHIILFLLIIWVSISSFWTVDRLALFNNWLNYVSAIIVALFFSCYLKNANRETLVFLLSLSAALMSLIGLLQYFGVIGPAFFVQDRMPASTFANKNLATPIVTLTLPLIYLQLVFCGSKKKLIFYAAFFIFCFAYLIAALTKSSILATFTSITLLVAVILNSEAIRERFSRALSTKRVFLLLGCLSIASGLIAIHEYGDFPKMFRSFRHEKTFLFALTAISLAAPIFAVLLRKLALALYKNKKRMWVSLAIVATFLTIFLSNLEIFKDSPGLYPFSIKTPGIESSIATRAPKIINSLAMFKDHPLLGVGLDGFIASYPLYHDAIVPDQTYGKKFWFGSLHNDPLQMLVELGIIGFALLLLLGLTFYRKIFTLIKQADMGTFPIYTGICLGITGLLIDACMNYPLHEPTSLFYAALCFGMVVSESEREQLSYKLKCPQPISYLLIAGILIAAISLAGLTSFSINKYRALSLHMRSHHKPPQSLSKESLLEYKTKKIREAAEVWPHSNYFMHASAVSSFDLLRENYRKPGEDNQKNYQYASYYTQKALEARPYNFELNYIRIWLLLFTRDQKNIKKADQYIPLLLRVAPKNNLNDAKLLANKLSQMKSGFTNGTP